MRREFDKQTKRAAFSRAAGQCEGTLEGGRRCASKLFLGKFHYDHDIPDYLGGEPTIENCVVLCVPCHKEKTRTRDTPAIAKTKRIRDREMGIRKPSQIRSPGFAKRPPQHSASRPLDRRP